MKFKLLKLVSSVSEPTKRHMYCVADKVNKHLSKTMKKQKTKNKTKQKMKKKKKSKSVKPLRYMNDFFSRLMTSHCLKVASYI